MTTKEKPIIAITMGDAAGIGPEIIVKGLQLQEIYRICCPLVVGESGIIQEAIKLVNSPLKLRLVKTPAELNGQFGVIDLLDLHNLDRKEVIIGQVCEACGRAAMDYIAKAA